MFSLKTRVIAKTTFNDCTHYTMEGIMASGSMVGRCDKCSQEMVVFTTGGNLFAENGKRVNMKALCEDYLHLKPIDVSFYPDCGNVEDYSDEFQVCCNECCDEIMEEYYVGN